MTFNFKPDTRSPREKLHDRLDSAVNQAAKHAQRLEGVYGVDAPICKQARSLVGTFNLLRCEVKRELTVE